MVNYVKMCELTLLNHACIRSVLRRFCEIQEDPPSLKEMTYERLKQVVVSYPELSKCPELKVCIPSWNHLLGGLWIAKREEDRCHSPR